MRVRIYDHITPILHSLHWLPVSFRIDYKVLLLTHQCIYGHARSYVPPFACLRASPNFFELSDQATQDARSLQGSDWYKVNPSLFTLWAVAC